MNINDFMEALPLLAFVEIGSAVYYVKEQEIEFGGKTAKVDHDALMSFEIDGKTALEIIESDDYRMVIDPTGGRGSSSSGDDDSMTFKFNHATDNGGGKPLPDESHFPSEMNDGDKFQSVDKAIEKFADKTKNAEREYAITVDESGYVHDYVTGGRVSVGVYGRKNQIIVHNHPSGGAFSDSDLLSVSQQPAKGIVATGSKDGTRGSYIFTKEKSFNATKFSKAVRNAKPKGKTYDDAIDKWLTANQNKYGYSYQFKAMK